VKLLGLLRHAKSDWDDLALRDFDRGLNGRGRKGARLMGAHIAQQGIEWATVLASPAERVRQTLDASGLDLPVDWRQDAYLAEGETLLAMLQGLPDSTGPILLVGHNPGLQDLLASLMNDNLDTALSHAALEKFPTAAFAMVECAVDRWADLAPGCGKLVRFVRPRDLDPQLGPKPDSVTPG
jgi:phosphohistidine phosphatase